MLQCDLVTFKMKVQYTDFSCSGPKIRSINKNELVDIFRSILVQDCALGIVVPLKSQYVVIKPVGNDVPKLQQYLVKQI